MRVVMYFGNYQRERVSLNTSSPPRLPLEVFFPGRPFGTPLNPTLIVRARRPSTTAEGTD